MNQHPGGPGRADLVRAEEDQAQAMIRRVSPQGRAEARRAREGRARRVRGLALGWLGIAAAVFVLYALASAAAGPFGPRGFALAAAAMLLACAALAWFTRERPAGAAVAPDAPLARLAEQTAGWAAAQRARLPAPAAALLGDIAARVDALAPHLSAIDGSADADALRRLVAGELPGLIDQYRAVPAPLRAEPGADGASPDGRLVHGLYTVERQLAELTRGIGAGAVDGLSTHDRYLDAKYRDPLGG